MDQFNRFFSGRPTTAIAKILLGHKLVYNGPHGKVGGLIVETEAYLGINDSASHAFGDRHTNYTASLYAEPGTLYIYQIRGMVCCDIVAQPAGEPHGILIRGIEPTIGIEQMAANRPIKGVNISNGPAKLMAALGISDRQLDGLAMAKAPLQISLTTSKVPIQVDEGPRIGVNPDGKDAVKPRRFSVHGNPYVSHTKRRDDREDHGWRTTYGMAVR
ncbi:MAG TPA: DNA-3-methyladenine glycosylase [Candidatus Limosilactobacillus merdipullorum]|uniref:Putative 3-methyladenine DNA glycosylase n=1 Tax=Candidatus Limosilactobacillus merdipullorum TaxID=2838653 RepID=A0A9D1QNJ9_9LACO|nr:DNA-3-methyladenine glycosylase [Candidatus Limosilactobacillus merdipullorum]